MDTVGEVRQVVVDCDGEVRRLDFVLCSVESTTHSVVYQGDGSLWLRGDSSLRGVVVIADGTLEGVVGTVKDEADETTHSVF